MKKGGCISFDTLPLISCPLCSSINDKFAPSSTQYLKQILILIFHLKPKITKKIGIICDFLKQNLIVNLSEIQYDNFIGVDSKWILQESNHHELGCIGLNLGSPFLFCQLEQNCSCQLSCCEIGCSVLLLKICCWTDIELADSWELSARGKK